jgi:AmmeMemoRadiSam system protein A
MTSRLSDAERQNLLKLAREGLIAAVKNLELPLLDLDSLPSRLREPGASFVTLTFRGELRGCIGTLIEELPLAEDVRAHAVAAASRDYRFSPVQADEITDIEIEISVLSTPKPLNYQHSEDLPKLLRQGIDGVIMIHGSNRATFLPQVWTKVPDAERFLDMLCEKALLPRNAWRKDHPQILTYQVECFHEASAKKL